MFIYDKYNNIITEGDIIKFDNQKYYLVLGNNGNLIIQNIFKYNPPLKLKSFVNKNNQVPAKHVCNIINCI